MGQKTGSKCLAVRVGLGATLLMYSLCSFSQYWNQNQERASSGDSSKRFLSGCVQVGHEFISDQLVFKPVKIEDYDQTLFFIHNIYHDNIKVKFHRTENTEIFPLWRTNIAIDRWAAFATDMQGLTFNCYEDYGNEAGQQIKCKDAVEVCQYPRAKFGENMKGNYWLTTNQTKIALRNKVIRSGVLLRK